MNRSQIGWSILAAVLALAAATAARGADIYELKISLAGAVSDEVHSQPAVTTIKITANQFINIAQGRNYNAPVAKTEKLALAIDCEGRAGSLIVFDTESATTKTVIATNAGNDFVVGVGGGQIIARFNLVTSGNSSNRFVSGYLILAGTFGLNSEHCPTGHKGLMIGQIDTVITDDTGTHDLPILITKGKLTLGKTVLGTTP